MKDQKNKRQTRGKKTKRTIKYHDHLIQSLSDPKEAAAYLNAVAEDNNIKSVLKAIRNIVEAQGGISKLAEKTNLSRTSLYKTLSEDGNPELITLDIILRAFGIRLGFFQKKEKQLNPIAALN